MCDCGIQFYVYNGVDNYIRVIKYTKRIFITYITSEYYMAFKNGFIYMQHMYNCGKQFHIYNGVDNYIWVIKYMKRICITYITVECYMTFKK